MTDDQPPKWLTEHRELDFSQFHPLDHWPGTAECRSMYGGTRNHLSMAWTFRWKSDLRARTVCQLGRHHWGKGWKRQLDGTWRGFIACRDCGKNQQRTFPLVPWREARARRRNNDESR